MKVFCLGKMDGCKCINIYSFTRECTKCPRGSVCQGQFMVHNLILNGTLFSRLQHPATTLFLLCIVFMNKSIVYRYTLILYAVVIKCIIPYYQHFFVKKQ